MINQHKCFTRVFSPQLIRNVRSRRRIDSSSIIAHPVNLRWERSLKCYAKNSTYIYMTLSLIDMDFLYQFNLRLIAPLFTVSFHEMFGKKRKVFQDFQKLAGLWLVVKMDNHVGIYGSKVAEGFSAFQRRSCWLCSHHRIIMKFSGVITNDQSKVHANGQGQRSKVKVTEVTTQLNRFRTVTPVRIHIWWWNDAYSLMLLRRGALLFFKVIRQISRSHGSKNHRIWPKLGVSGL